MSWYDLQYEISEALADEVDAIAPVELYNVDPNQLLLDGLVRMSQPLEDGSPSPLSSRNILSAEAIILGNLLIQLQYFGHELNLFPDSLFLTFFRLLGLTRQRATSPLIELSFTVAPTVVETGETISIQAGTKIRSRFQSDRTAIVIQNTEVVQGENTIEAVARIDSPGRLSVAVRNNEFSLLPLSMSKKFTSVTNNQMISYGSDTETVTETIARARSFLSRPGNRVVTARDYQEVALAEGNAETAIVLPRIAISQDKATVGWGDLITVAVYPETAVATTTATLTELIPVGTRLDVVAARVIPIDGTIRVGIDPSLSVSEAFDLVATAVVDFINPPNSKWGDKGFVATLSSAIEKIIGIYSVKVELLKHAISGELLQDMNILPHDLFEIQDTIEFIWEI